MRYREILISSGSSGIGWQAVAVYSTSVAVTEPGTWDRIKPILDRWIPVPRILHPYPMDRFDARIQGRSRMRRCARTDLCGGRSAMVVPTATPTATDPREIFRRWESPNRDF